MLQYLIPAPMEHTAGMKTTDLQFKPGLLLSDAYILMSGHW